MDLTASTGLFSTVEIVAGGLVSSSEGSGFSIVVRDGANNTLSEYEFEPVTPLERPDCGHFSLVLPCPEGVHDVLLYRGNQLLDTWTRSDAAPSVTLTAPSDGFIAPSTNGFYVIWNASDPDSTNLYADVYFSTDGTTWENVGSAQGADQLFIRSESLAQTSTGRLRVDVSDGYNTAQAAMTERFRIPYSTGFVARTACSMRPPTSARRRTVPPNGCGSDFGRHCFGTDDVGGDCFCSCFCFCRTKTRFIAFRH